MGSRDTSSGEPIGSTLAVRLATWLLPVALAAFAIAVAAQLSELSRRSLLLGLGGVALFACAVASRHAKQVLLFGWVLALTYTRYFFVEALHPEGAQGLYWIPADVCFLGLLLVWGWDRVVRKEPPVRVGAPLWPWLVPFAVACVLSTLAAKRMDWGVYELVRIAKMLLILAFVRANVGRDAWWTCILALGTAIAAQAALGALQFATQNPNSGALAILGLGEQVDLSLLEFDQGAAPGLLRAKGTLAHPNILAAYFELVIPVLFALGLTLPNPRLRGLALGAAGIGLVGVVATLSRLPWLLVSIQLGVVALYLTHLNLISLRRVIGSVLVVAVLGLIAAFPFREKIMERITSNLSESFEVRGKLNRLALDLAETGPFLGVGLNNFPAAVPRDDPELAWYLNSADDMRKVGIRAQLGVHNAYLHLLAETGLFGLAGFCIFLLGVVRAGLRAVRTTRGPLRIASFALLVGVLGVAAQELTGFELLTDPILYSFTLVAALLAQASWIEKAGGAAPASTTGRPSRA
jgi:O-antigen ligase